MNQVCCIDSGTGVARRYRNEPNPGRYLERSATPAVEVFEEPLSPQMLVQEALMLGLRTSEGVLLGPLAQRTGIDPLATRQPALARAQAKGNVLLDQEVLRVPHERWLHLDSIVADLF